MNDRATPAATELDFPTQLITDGDVLDADVEYVWHRLLPVVQKLDEPVHLVRVKLGLAEVGRPLRATAQVLVDVHGDLVRAHVAAETMSEAIDRIFGIPMHTKDRGEGKFRTVGFTVGLEG